MNVEGPTTTGTTAINVEGRPTTYEPFVARTMAATASLGKEGVPERINRRGAEVDPSNEGGDGKMDLETTSSHSSGSNPLMTLVDAAESLSSVLPTQKHPVEARDEPKAQQATSSIGKSEKDLIVIVDDNEPSSEHCASPKPTVEEVEGAQSAAGISRPPSAAPTAAAGISCPPSTAPTSAAAAAAALIIGGAGVKKPSFPEDLMNALDDERYHDVLAWMPNGLAFTIVDHKKFVRHKMSELFNIRNMSSFVRKLTRWGFHRHYDVETRNSDVFRHPHFARNRRDMLPKVRSSYCNTISSSNSSKSGGEASTLATAAFLGLQTGLPSQQLAAAARVGQAPIQKTATAPMPVWENKAPAATGERSSDKLRTLAAIRGGLSVAPSPSSKLAASPSKKKRTAEIGGVDWRRQAIAANRVFGSSSGSSMAVPVTPGTPPGAAASSLPSSSSGRHRLSKVGASGGVKAYHLSSASAPERGPVIILMPRADSLANHPQPGTRLQISSDAQQQHLRHQPHPSTQHLHQPYLPTRPSPQGQAVSVPPRQHQQPLPPQALTSRATLPFAPKAASYNSSHPYHLPNATASTSASIRDRLLDVADDPRLPPSLRARLVSVALDTHHAAQHSLPQHPATRHQHLRRTESDQGMVMTNGLPASVGISNAMMDASGRSVVSASSCQMMDASLGRSTSSTFSTVSSAPYPTFLMHQQPHATGSIVGCNVVHRASPHLPCRGAYSCHVHNPYFYGGFGGPTQSHDVTLHHHHRTNGSNEPSSTAAAMAISRLHSTFPPHMSQMGSLPTPPPVIPVELGATAANSSSAASHSCSQVETTTRGSALPSSTPETTSTTSQTTVMPPMPAAATISAARSTGDAVRS